MFLYYMWNAYQTLGIRKHRLNVEQSDWSKVEPKVTAAQKRSAELNDIISTTKVLDGMIDSRFYLGAVPGETFALRRPNAQITSVDGTVLDENKGVSVMIEGLAAGREPRAAAEELRQLLLEQLGQSYHDVKVEFKTLEDLDTLVNDRRRQHGDGALRLSATFNPSSVTTGKAAVPPPPAANEMMKSINLTQRPDPEARAQRDGLRRSALRLLQFLPRASQQEPRFDAGDDQRSPKQARQFEKRNDQSGQSRKTGQRGDDSLCGAYQAEPGRRAHRLVPARMKIFFSNQQIDKTTARLE